MGGRLDYDRKYYHSRAQEMYLQQPFLSCEDIAEVLGISVSTVYKYISEVRVPNHKRFRFLSPEGELVEVGNLTEFCSKHSLNLVSMSSLHCGRQKTHRGWRKAPLSVLPLQRRK